MGYNSFTLLFKYLKYYLSSQNKHDIHSPFVFDLVTTIIDDPTPFYVFEPIEILRKQLLSSNKEIEVSDFGAGSRSGLKKKRKVADIAQKSLKPAKYGQLIFKLINRFQPHNMLELGTSLGITSIYQSKPNSQAKLITIEGCPETAAVAQRNFDILKAGNIELKTGNFDQLLPSILKDLPQLDYVYFDGNHRKEPTIRYFEECLPKAHNDTLFIFDDIHWSEEMEEAWEYIKKHPQVTVTIDLFFLGLVFFRSEQAKQHFVIRY